MAVKTQQIEGKCCYVCGHLGWKELLVPCAQCNELAIHKYCLGIIPGSAEDTLNYYWRCYYCLPQSMDSSTDNNQTSSNIDISSNSDQCYNQIIMIEEQPKPLRTVFPKGHGHHKDTYEDEAAEIVGGVVLIVRPSGEAIIVGDIDTLISINNVSRKPVKKVMNSGNNVRRSRRLMEELGVHGWRKSPRFKRRNILRGGSKRVTVC